MSTSIALVTCADVSSERRMCSAMPLRIAVIGSKLSPNAGCACGSAARRGASVDEGKDVLLRYASATARALHLARIDAVLRGDLRHDRGDECLAIGRRAVYSLRRRCRLDRLLLRRGHLADPLARGRHGLIGRGLSGRLRGFFLTLWL